MQRNQEGFTLIELVIVIVILGILSAFALPRFADLGGDARGATLQGAQGSVKSAAAIAHSKWLAEGGEPTEISLENAPNVSMSGEGYPTSDSSGIGTAAQIDTDFTLTAGSDVDTDSATIQVDGAATPSECQFQYDPQTGTTSSFDDTGC